MLHTNDPQNMPEVSRSSKFELLLAACVSEVAPVDTPGSNPLVWLSFPPLIVCSFAARACKVDAERLCNNTWLVGAALDGSIISCLR